MAERIIPALGHLIVKELPNADITDSGLYVPQQHSKGGGTTGHGKVLACFATIKVDHECGDGPCVKVGDHACWEFGAGYKQCLAGMGEVLILKAEDILGIIVED